MDVNETRFHLVLHRDEWLGSSDLPEQSGIHWDSGCSAVTLQPEPFRFPPPAETPLLRPEDRRGAARDQYGNWYWIAESGTEIRILPINRDCSSHFWDAGDMASTCEKEPGAGIFKPEESAQPRVLQLKGLAVTCLHFLVVGVVQPAGLLVFDLHSGGTPTHIVWPKEEPFAPFDITSDTGGGVWILDSENARCWELDRYFQPAPSCPYELEAKHAVAIETAPDGSFFILDTNPGGSYSTVYNCIFKEKDKPFTSRGISLWPLLKQEKICEPLEQAHLRGHDMAFVDAENGEDSLTGTLYISDSEGNQAFAFRLEADGDTFSLELQPHYFPMRLYSGKALAAYGQDVYYDIKEHWLPLTRMPRCRYQTEGKVTLPVFDGKEPRCVWHRLFIDAYIPAGTSVIVESYASDEENDVPEKSCSDVEKDDETVEDDKCWYEEPAPYRRANGPELPYYNAFFPDENPLDGIGTWELLFQKARGRYLYLRLALTGNGTNTPVLFAMRIYYPRFSYLNEYLPALYRENETSASFLDRFLANIEGFYTVLEGRIAEVQALFDADIIPGQYLEWLAGWFGVVLDPAWDEDRRRLFLRHAVELFRQRGTLSGIIRAVRLAIDPCPDDSLFEENVSGYCYQKAAGYRVRIVEGFLTRSRPGVVFGDPTDIIGPALISEDEPWQPAHGTELLQQSCREYLKKQYINTASNLSHRKAYREFLARKYRRVDRLNQAVGMEFGSFKEVGLPEGELPSNPQQLADLIQFVSCVLPVKQGAHFFTVLVPVELHMDNEGIQRRLDWVERIVEMEKPAHTNFQVKPYWALFQVGTARVGLDTVPGMGSRFTALVLGKNALDESYLQPAYPWNLKKRWVLGRDSVGPASGCDIFREYKDEHINKKLLRGGQGGGFLEKSPPGRTISKAE